MKFSIIIPTKDRGSVFYQTLTAAYNAIKQLDAEIIVINDSKTKLPEVPPSFLDKVRLLNNPNSGVASARNYGIKHAKGMWLILMDDDILISRANISEAIIFMEKQQNKRICLNLNWMYPEEIMKDLNNSQFGRYLINFGFVSLEGKGWLAHTFREREKLQIIKNAASFFLVIEKQLFDEIGGYTESFSFSGFEDYDFAKKLTDNNIMCYILPECTVLHNESDRLDIRNWMARRYRAGITRRQAVNIGHPGLKLSHNKIKNNFYSLLIKISPLLYKILEIIPNNKLFDSIYFKITNILLGTSIFHGYHSKYN